MAFGALATGILGGVKGFGESMVTLSDEARKALAEKVRREAEEAMLKRSDERKHRLDMERMGKEREFTASQNKLERESRESIAKDNRVSAENVAKIGAGSRVAVANIGATMDKYVADMNLWLNKKQLEAQQGLADQKMVANQLKAYEQIREYLDSEQGMMAMQQDPQSAVDYINGVARSVGIPDWETYVAQEESRHLNPFKEDKEEIIGVRPKASNILGGPQPQTDKETLDELEAQATESGAIAEPVEMTPQPKSQPKEAMTPAEAKKYTTERNRAILSSAFSGPEVPQEGEIREWGKTGEYQIYENGGWRALTEEEKIYLGAEYNEEGFGQTIEGEPEPVEEKLEPVEEIDWPEDGLMQPSKDGLLVYEADKDEWRMATKEEIKAWRKGKKISPLAGKKKRNYNEEAAKELDEIDAYWDHLSKNMTPRIRKNAIMR